MSQFDEIKKALIDGRDNDVERMTKAAVDDGSAPEELLEQGLIAGMEIIGERFRLREIFLPDVLLAARAMMAGVDVLRPLLEGAGARAKGTVVIGTVEGDLHDIGKNLVGIMLRGAGYEVVDLGNSASPAAFVEAVQEHDADVIGMSALLTTTMPVMKRIIVALEKAGLSEVKTIIGGAPVSDAFAQEIGANAYGYDAARAVEIIRSWIA